MLARAQADLAVPVVEYSPRVVAMLAAVGLTAPHDWNAAAVSTWIREAAAAAGQHSPIAGAATGAGLVAQLIAAKRWIARAHVTAAHVVPGMMAARGAPGAVLVGVVSAIDVAHGRLTTIHGDAGEGHDRVAVRYVLLSDPLFLGCGGV